MIENLVYDVGMYDGADTAYYLKLGHRVVAVEADPALCHAARERFKAEISDGRLIIEECAITADPGPERTVTFTVNRQNREWNSLIRDNAARRHEACEAITVRAERFESVLARHGVPLYLKVDIEGSDLLCADAISPHDRPRFVSFEFSDDTLIDVLLKKRFTRFKCIRQTDLRGLQPGGGMHPMPPRSAIMEWFAQRPGRLKKKIVRVFRGKDASRAKKSSTLPDGSMWRFGGSSSGPFGEHADGPWLSADELRSLWTPWSQARAAAGKNWLHWFDLHAT